MPKSAKFCGFNTSGSMARTVQLFYEIGSAFSATTPNYFVRLTLSSTFHYKVETRENLFLLHGRADFSPPFLLSPLLLSSAWVIHSFNARMPSERQLVQKLTSIFPQRRSWIRMSR